jgi:uncharacterized protein (TIGR01777 family)
MRRVLVGGGSGFIGSKVVQGLETRGYQVTVVSRQPGHGRVTWDKLRHNGFDKEYHAVLNAAGALVFDPLKRWNAQMERECRNSRIETAKTLARCIDSCTYIKPSVFLQISGIGFYEPRQDVVQDESFPAGSGYWGQFTREWEQSAQPLSSPETRMIFVRPGVVLGKDGGAFPAIKRQFQLFAGGVQGDGSHQFPWVHVDDLVALCIFCIEHQEISGPVNAVSPNPITNAHFTEVLASSMHRPRLVPTPRFALEILLGKTRTELLLDNPQAVPRKLLDAGYQFKHPQVYQCIQSLL